MSLRCILTPLFRWPNLLYHYKVSFKTKTRGAIQHLAIDATGLKVYGEGKWKVKKHGTDGKRRVWRKLHIAVDTSTHEIVAAELSLSNVTDAEVLPNLLKQTRRKIIEISGDGAYDTRNCHDAIRIKQAVALIPPREGAAFWEQGHPRNLAVGCQKLYGSNRNGKSGMAIISAHYQRQQCTE